MATKNSVIEKESPSKKVKAQRHAIKESTTSSICITRASANKNNERCDRSQWKLKQKSRDGDINNIVQQQNIQAKVLWKSSQ